MLLHIMSDVLNQLPPEPSGLLVTLRVTGRSKVVPPPYQGTYNVEELRRESQTVVSEEKTRRSVKVKLIFLEPIFDDRLKR